MKFIYTKSMGDVPHNYTGYTNYHNADEQLIGKLVYIKNGLNMDVDKRMNELMTRKEILIRTTKLGKLIYG